MMLQKYYKRGIIIIQIQYMLYKSENSRVYGEHMKHTTRIFATMIKEICREEGVCIESFLDNRIFKLRKDSMYQYIFDYQFGLNPERSHFKNASIIAKTIRTGE